MHGKENGVVEPRRCYPCRRAVFPLPCSSSGKGERRGGWALGVGGSALYERRGWLQIFLICCIILMILEINKGETKGQKLYFLVKMIKGEN